MRIFTVPASVATAFGALVALWLGVAALALGLIFLPVGITGRVLGIW